MIGTRGEEFGVRAFPEKQRPAHIHSKKKKMERERRGMREFLFVCPAENLRSFLSSPSSHLLLSFLDALSHEAPLPPKHHPDL